MKKYISRLLYSLISLSATVSAQENMPIDTQPPQEICSPTECYVVIKKLGEGAFGEVFAVKDSQGELYAIKTFKQHDSQTIFNDSEREYLRGQTLQHPNIIKSYELFNSPSDPAKKYLVLQFVNGETLFNTSKGSLQNDQAIGEAAQLCGALQYALSEGFIHFDLHGGNLMLNTESEVMVIDLASFLSLDEIVDSFLELEKEFQMQEKPMEGQAAASKKVKTKGLRSEPKDPKIQQFFMQNPMLIKRLQVIREKHHSEMAQHKKQRLKKKAKESNETQVSEDDDLRNIYKQNIAFYYFQSVTEICSEIISKSTLNRDDKFNQIAEIMKTRWHYKEDLEDQCGQPVEAYFEKLREVLQRL